MAHVNSEHSARPRLLQAIGCGISAVLVIGALLLSSIGPGASTVPIVLAAPGRSQLW